MSRILVVLGESVWSAGLGPAVRRHTAAAAPGAHVVVVAPRVEPHFGLLVYDDERRDVAISRLQVALASLTDTGISASGLVTGSGPRASVLDVVDDLDVDEVIVALPGGAASRRHERMLAHLRQATGLPVDALAVERPTPGAGSPIQTLVVAGETASAESLHQAIVAHHRTGLRHFTLLVRYGAGRDEVDGRRRMTELVDRLRSDGLSVDGVLGHRDPYTAIRNVLATDCIDEILIAPHPPARPGRPRRDLVERVRRLTSLPVESDGDGSLAA